MVRRSSRLKEKTEQVENNETLNNTELLVPQGEDDSIYDLDIFEEEEEDDDFEEYYDSDDKKELAKMEEKDYLCDEDFFESEDDETEAPEVIEARLRAAEAEYRSKQKKYKHGVYVDPRLKPTIHKKKRKRSKSSHPKPPVKKRRSARASAIENREKLHETLKEREKGTKKRKPTKKRKYKVKSFEERLRDAEKVVKQNELSLNRLIEKEEFEKTSYKMKHLKQRQILSGPLIRFTSTIQRNTLTFTETTEIPPLLGEGLQIPLAAQFCVMTFQKPAKYVDPETGCGYNHKKAFQLLRSCYSDYVDTIQHQLNKHPNLVMDKTKVKLSFQRDILYFSKYQYDLHRQSNPTIPFCFQLPDKNTFPVIIENENTQYPEVTMESLTFTSPSKPEEPSKGDDLLKNIDELLATF